MMRDNERKAIAHLVGPGPTDDKRLVMTIDDLVALGIGSRNTLYRLARLNQLPVPTITVGRKLYVSKLAIEKLLLGERDHIDKSIDN